MNKKIIVALCSVLFVIISCGYMSRNNQKTDDVKVHLDEANLLEGDAADMRTDDYDPAVTEALDKAVMEQAKLRGEDPKTYRMKVRTEADGTVIYRMLGMHVFVSAQGEESYLPD